MISGVISRLVLFVLIAALALVVGFATFTPALAVQVVSKVGYWVILAGFLCWSYALIAVAREINFRALWQRREHGLPVGLALIGAVIFVLHEPTGYKVLYDELLLMANSMQMHFERIFLTAGGAHNTNGSLLIFTGHVDKRPLFFVFLCSLIHDLTGYRTANVFALNAVLTAICLLLAYFCGFKLGGRRVGLVALLLLIGLPLLGQNATGAGFEILNLVMILLGCLLGIRYFERRDDVSLSAFTLTIVLLAQTRYESALFVLSGAIVILHVWWSQRTIRLPWALLVAPLLLVLIPLQNKAFTYNPRFWQLPKGVAKPFATDFFDQNVGHAAAFFFSFGDRQPNSIVLSVLGVFGVAFLWMFVWSKRQVLEREYPAVWVLAAFALVVMANFFLLLCYHWGTLDQYVVARLGLPMCLIMALSAAFVVGEFVRKSPVVLKIVCIFLIIGILAQGLPVQAKAIRTRQEVITSEVNWQSDVIKRNPRNDVLYIARAPLVGVVERKPSISIYSAQQGKDGLRFHMLHGTYREVLVFQRLEYHVDEGRWKPSQGDELDEDFVMEKIDERLFRPMVRGRLSRLVSIKGSGPADIPPVATLTDTISLGEEYYNQFYRSLPW